MPAESINTLIEVVDDLTNEVKRTTFTTRVVVGATVLLSLLALAVGGIGIREIHRADTERCQAGNEFRTADRARWNYIIGLSPPPRTQEDRERLQKFEGYISTADALQHC